MKQKHQYREQEMKRWREELCRGRAKRKCEEEAGICGPVAEKEICRCECWGVKRNPKLLIRNKSQPDKR